MLNVLQLTSMMCCIPAIILACSKILSLFFDFPQEMKTGYEIRKVGICLKLKSLRVGVTFLINVLDAHQFPRVKTSGKLEY